MRLAAPALLLLLLSGCATWKKHGVLVRPPRRVRVAVLPMQGDLGIANPSRIETVPPEIKAKHLTRSEKKELARSLMAENLSRMSAELVQRLSQSYAFEVVGASSVVRALALENIDPKADLWKLKPAQVESLARDLKADAVLRTRLAGYGAVKFSWVLLPFSLDFLHGVITGAIVLAATNNTAAAAGTWAAGAAQDILTWGGGAYLFNKFLVPVILQGELLSGSDGLKVASKTSMNVYFYEKAIKDYPPERRGLKQTHLRIVEREAIDGMVRYFQHEAMENEAAQEGDPMEERLIRKI